jgi:hypothetical protein
MEKWNRGSDCCGDRSLYSISTRHRGDGFSELSSPSYQGLLNLRFFLPSSLARLSVAAVRSAGVSGAAASTRSPAGETTLSTAHQLGRKLGRAAACRALNLPRASLYRHLRPIKPTAPPAPRPSPPRALASAEHQRVLEVLNSQRFRDKPPGEVFATPLDEGTSATISDDYGPPVRMAPFRS